MPGLQGLLDDLQEACRGCSTALTAAVAFLDSRQLGMVALLDRQAKELLRQVQVGHRCVVRRLPNPCLWKCGSKAMLVLTLWWHQRFWQCTAVGRATQSLPPLIVSEPRHLAP